MKKQLYLIVVLVALGFQACDTGTSPQAEVNPLVGTW
jgi:hypothetical protein